MNKKSSFFIVGKHAVIEALKNPKRKVLRIFLTEESKKEIHRISPRKNLLNRQKIFFKTKKELDKYCGYEQLTHQGFVAEIEFLETYEIKEFIKNKTNITFVCLDGVTDPRNIGSIIRSAVSFNIDGIIVNERNYPKDTQVVVLDLLNKTYLRTAKQGAIRLSIFADCEEVSKEDLLK